MFQLRSRYASSDHDDGNARKESHVRTLARRVWATIHGVDRDALLSDETDMPRPSPLYAPPLLSLLSHSDMSIALATADAYAKAMVIHSNFMSQNIEILCTTYIDSFPTSDPSNSSKAMSSLPVAPNN
jgi:hypothetical protein